MKVLPLMKKTDFYYLASVQTFLPIALGISHEY